MKKSRKFSKVYLRFLLSFLLILILPLSILGGISAKTIRDIMLDHETERKISTFSQNASGIQNELENVATIVFKASVEQEFSPYIVSDFVGNSRGIISLLKNYKTANNFIQEIYLVSDYSDYIFSSSTTYTYDRFLEQKIPEELSREELLSLLEETVSNSRYGYLDSTDDSVFFLTYPLPNNALTSYAYMIFEIPKKALLNYFTVSNHLMVLEGDTLIASFSDYPEEQQQELISRTADGFSDGSADYFEIERDGSRFCYYLDEQSGLTFIVSVSDTAAMLEIRQVMLLFIGSLLLILLFGTVGILLLTTLNYSPIKRLVKSTSGIFDGSMSGSRVNEFDYLQEFVHKTQSSIQKMNLELQESLLPTKYFFIKSLINGYPYTPKELENMLQRTAMHFVGEHYFVAVFHPDKALPGSSAIHMTEFLSSFPLEGITGYAAKLYDENVVGIYSSERRDMDKVKDQFSLLHERVNSEFSVMLTAGIGCFKPDLLSLASSFIEASTALDYRFVFGKNKLISFYDLKLNSYAEIDYPQGQIDTLCLQIKTGQEKEMAKTLKALFSYIRENSYSMYTARSLCYDVTNSIIKTLKELENSNANFQFPNLITLTAFETIEELEQMLYQFCKTACDYVNTLKPLSLSEKTINYITKNFSNPDFSIGNIAESLGVSASHLSRTFKEQQSVTLSDYIKLYKIELAKKMLTETTDPLDKIIQLLGYYDTSSFIRMFKKIEGLTPGEYRKNNQS